MDDVIEVNPYARQPGFWNRVNRVLYPIFGPAQITSMEPMTPGPRGVCPVCQRLVDEHRFDRQVPGRPTVMTCPT